VIPLVILYLYAGLMIAEASVNHKKDKPLIQLDKAQYIVLVIGWGIVMPIFFLWRSNRK
jgi:hypothetical protein